MCAPGRPRCSLPPILGAALCLLGLFAPAPAGAVISGVHQVEGASADVTEVGDAAMADDGSGGIVYLKRAEGRNHVFVVRFVDGVWGKALRVDTGQSFDSSWPRIAAGDGGRLLVTWVQEFGVGTDRMFSATLDPGADGFEEPVPVDLNIGEATATYPDLAMNAGGQAFIAYLVITDTSTQNPKGFLGINVRVARYNSRLWSVAGNSLDRNPATPMPEPTEATGPQVGIDINGGAVVAWREPDDEFVNRIWARRVFGTTFGIPLQVSPSSWENTPLRGEADAFSLDDAGFGQVAVAFRQQPGPSSKLTAPRLFVDEMPDAFAEGASSFKGARIVDGGVLAALGPPGVAVEPEGGFVTGFGSGTATLIAGGDNTDVGAVRRIDSGASTSPAEPKVDIAESGASVAAWSELIGGGGRVSIREVGADGVPTTEFLSAPGGTTVSRVTMGGSGLGDALVAWKQGSGPKAQIAAAVVDAPPDKFLIQVPEGWQRKPKMRIGWSKAENAIGGLRYAVSVDDELIGRRTRRLQAFVKRGQIGEGRHRAQIIAVDDAGQETGSRFGTVLVDAKAPKLSLATHGRRLTVTVFDGPSHVTAGVKAKDVRASFGDGRPKGPSKGGAGGAGSGGGAGGGGGAHTISRPGVRRDKEKGKAAPSRVTLRHTFAAPGVYRVHVAARDRAGNTVSLSRKLRIR